jgi:ubiquinone/menaquinone biosynthesis C-methylase UbiE
MSSERQEHNEKSPWWGEHIQRYYAAFDYISGNDKILDIACGTGFGSHLLSLKSNGKIIGGDISKEAIEYCSLKYTNQSNLEFQIMDGTCLPFTDDYFDIIVSFETIEHTTAYKKMLEEFYRTLKNKGTAIISTPNIIVNTPEGVPLSPFHTQEFTYEEFAQILKEEFDDIQLFGQKYIRYEHTSFRNTIAKFFENILYKKGFRKIPITVQDKIMKFLINKDMYPAPDDFVLVNEKQEILNCKTFYAVCRKN